ncbi:MAG: hypothetical protein WDW38_008676 [Sanguina aurantia]
MMEDGMAFFKKFFDFKTNFMPKSTRIWRNQEYEYPGPDKPTAPGEEPTASDLVDDLQARMNQVSASQRPKLDGDDLPPPVADSSKKPRGSEGSRGSTSTLDRPSFSAGSTFEEASNSDLASSLSARFAQLSRESASDSERESDRESDRESERDSDRDDTDDDPPVALASDASMDEVVEPLTGPELRRLLFTKFGKTYDLSFIRRDIPGKTFIALNVMWTHLEQRSFQLTEEQYMEKMDGVSYRLNVLGQTTLVRSFLQQPARAKGGLPKRPVMGTAVSIRLDLTQTVIDEWFGNGFQ